MTERVFASVSWAGGDVTDGLTVANTSLNQFKKKKTEALTGTQHFLLLFNVFTVSYNNSGIS